MGIIDIVIISLAAFLGVIGLLRGFVKEIFSLGAWIISLAIAFFSFKLAIPLVISLSSMSEGITTSALAFVGIFIISFLVIKIIIRSLSKGVKKSAFGLFDRLLGLAWGAGKALLIISLLFLAIDFIKTLPLIGDTINNFITSDLKLATSEMGIGRYLYEHNFASILIEFATNQFGS